MATVVQISVAPHSTFYVFRDVWSFGGARFGMPYLLGGGVLSLGCVLRNFVTLFHQTYLTLGIVLLVGWLLPQEEVIFVHWQHLKLIVWSVIYCIVGASFAALYFLRTRFFSSIVK